MPDDLSVWISQLFKDPDLHRMGHYQRPDDLNLGLGWLYYALLRVLRPGKVVVVGSYRGFVPLVLGKALQDNSETGEVIFIDPSLADNFWEETETVKKYFQHYGLSNVRHFKMTTQEFVKTAEYKELGEIGLVFIDGHHSEEQVEFDYNAFEGLLMSRGMILFHDSMVVRDDKVYGSENAYEMRVKYFIDRLKENPELQIFDFPFGSTGVTLLRKIKDTADRSIHDWLDGPP